MIPLPPFILSQHHSCCWLVKSCSLFLFLFMLAIFFNSQYPKGCYQLFGCWGIAFSTVPPSPFFLVIQVSFILLIFLSFVTIFLIFLSLNFGINELEYHDQYSIRQIWSVYQLSIKNRPSCSQGWIISIAWALPKDRGFK